MTTYSRHVIPRRLTLRWFATRGWAFGGAITFGIAAFWFRPPVSAIGVTWLAIGLGLAAVSLLMVGLVPECVTVRLLAVAFTVTVTLIRSWALMVDDAQHWHYRVASALIWVWIAVSCWGLATLTAKVPNRKV